MQTFKKPLPDSIRIPSKENGNPNEYLLKNSSTEADKQSPRLLNSKYKTKVKSDLALKRPCQHAHTTYLQQLKPIIKVTNNYR